MALDINSSRSRQPSQGISTRTMLVAAVVLLVAGVTCASLWIIRYRLREQVSRDFAADLARSVETFEGVDAQRRTALQRENALLADLPSLKALMTTSDDSTIADGAIEFWQVSGNDLFALAARDGRVAAVYTRGAPATQTLRRDLQTVLQHVDKHYLLGDGRLFEYSVRPLYFGDHATGTLLGYVVTGYAMNTAFVTQISRPSSAEAVFVADGHIVASTLPVPAAFGLQEPFRQFASTAPRTMVLGGEGYLATSADLSSSANGPLHLVILKSLRRADLEVQQINRLVAAVGLLAVLVGCTVMLVVSGWLTRPLEALARSVRAFATGDSNHPLPARGTREVRELSAEFDRMRTQIQEANRALLEAERLATIGRMASSVSHDLRHYLAAVYANAEFLASSRLSDAERAELFADIRLAVLGTTDLIDSMLVFSRTGQAVQRTPERIAPLIDRTIALVNAHPDADGVVIRTGAADGTEIIAVVDAKLVERAIYNLVLNGCQSARGSAGQPSVLVELGVTSDYVCVVVTDNGPGVPEGIRDSLFEPFVSEGKQKGTGLGLTLTQRIAEEHGGTVELFRSRPGETVFMLSLKRNAHHEDASPSEGTSSAQERSHERR